MRHNEKIGYVYTNKSPEVPKRCIDHVSVKSEDQAPEYKKQGGPRVGRTAKPDSHQSITARFQAGGA